MGPSVWGHSLLAYYIGGWGCWVSSSPNLFFSVTLCLENLSSGENLAVSIALIIIIYPVTTSHTWMGWDSWSPKRISFLVKWPKQNIQCITHITGLRWVGWARLLGALFLRVTWSMSPAGLKYSLIYSSQNIVVDCSIRVYWSNSRSSVLFAN